MLFHEFRRRGYDVVPVTPHAAEVEGLPCFPHVQDIKPPVEGALLLTNPSITDAVVRDCAAANIGRVWMHRATGAGAVSASAIAFCQDRGIHVVAGECPFMFFPNSGGVHRLHRFLRRVFGKLPK